ncbi:MAG: hypothetical protein VW518_01360, partial [Burkholderiaceae bacterium]
MDKKRNQIKVTPNKPYYSSKELGNRFESRLPSALVEEDFEKRSPFGKYSPKTALYKGINEVIDLFSNDFKATLLSFDQ